MLKESVLELKAETWMSDVEQSAGMMLVYFWAPWCGHCKMFSSTYDEVAAEIAGNARFAKLNCDEHGSVAAQCKVTGTPTVIVYIDGKEADRIVGGLSRNEFLKYISQRLPIK